MYRETLFQCLHCRRSIRFRETIYLTLHLLVNFGYNVLIGTNKYGTCHHIVWFGLSDYIIGRYNLGIGGFVTNNLFQHQKNILNAMVIVVTRIYILVPPSEPPILLLTSFTAKKES